MSFKVLESVLRPLSYWYTQDNIEEVAINRSKQIWLRLRGKRAYPWVMYKDEKLTKEYLTDLLYIIANTYELPFDPVSGTPVVYAAIPGEHRFSAIAGRNVMYDDEDLTGGIALTIRVHSEDVAWGLKDYGLAQGEKLHKVNPLKDIKDPEDPYERLLVSIKRGDHMKILDIHKRILTIEDTRELMVPHPNRVHLVLSRTAQTNELTYAKVIDLVVRFTPDAIIGGEISTGNAGAIWELMGSGHDNCLATIHAESSEAAYAAFADRILHSYPTMDRKKVIEEMRQKLRVVQINRDGNLRAVTEVR